MGLISSDDLTQMRSDLVDVRGDREVNVTIRRGNSPLATQPVRIARMGSGQGQEKDSEAGQETRGRVVVLGGVTLDIEVGDRFNAYGDLYRVIFVRPNRDTAVMAEAEIVE
jgi:hypothetical protein